VARRNRLGQRAAPRPAADRDDAARNRARVRGQGCATRDPRPGRPRPEDPAPEVRDRARGEEPPPRRAARGGRPRRPDGGVRRTATAVRRSTSTTAPIPS
jgi:hypothetical protein